MATYSGPAARLLALCERGDQKQLLPLLQDSDILTTVLGTENIVLFPSPQFASVPQPFLILERMIAVAARGGYVELVSALLQFGQQHGVAPPYMVTTSVVRAALDQVANSLNLLLALQRVQPEVFSIRLPMGRHILETVCLGSENEPQARLLLLRHMMEMGFDPNMHLSRHGRERGVLLCNASRYASCEMVRCLLNHGAVIKKSNALRGAAKYGRIDVLEVLLQYGADLDESSERKDQDGPAGTAFHVAAANGQAEAARWLMTHGASPALENRDGNTPGDLLAGDNNELALLLGQGNYCGLQKECSTLNR
jgi:hypothetical protein